MFKKITLILVIFLIGLTFYAFSILKNRGDIVWLFSSEDMLVKVEEVTKGLGVIWGIDFVDKKRLIFTERSGEIGILDITTGTSKIIHHVDNLFVKRECGLLDVKVSPNFKETKIIYFTYAKKIDNGGYTSLASATLNNGHLSNWKDLFISINTKTDDGRHCGSRITFDDEGHMFMSLGDRGKRGDVQNLSNHLGKIIRLNLDGSIPVDNPFYSRDDSLPEIWSYGHRNPQGLFYDRGSARLWSNEHGPRGGDELNLILKGKNYGWPVITYGKEYLGGKIGKGSEKDGIEKPYKIWSPSIAPSCLIKYEGHHFSNWKGNLFSTTLAQQHINRLQLDSTGRVIFEERLLEDIHERFRTILSDSEGHLFLSTESGRVLKMSLYENENVYFFTLFKHIDIPGIYLSFDIKYMFNEN